MNKQWPVVRKYLSLAAVGLSVVSFYTTAQGLYEFVFHEMWQALLISGAVQISLFVLNLKLFYFFKKKWWVAVTLWILTITASSTFSYVYIANEIYNDSLYYSDVNRIMDEKVTNLSFQLKDHIDASTAYVKETMNAYCSTLSVPADTSVTSPSKPVKDLIANCTSSLKTAALFSGTDTVFRQCVKLMEDAVAMLPDSYTDAQIGSTIASVEMAGTNLLKLKTNTESKVTSAKTRWTDINERLKQYKNFRDPEFQKLQDQNNEIEAEIKELEDNLIEIDTAISSTSLCIQKLTAEKDSNIANRMTASRENLLLEVNKETPDTQVIETSLNDIYGLLIRQGYAGDSSQINNYFNFKQAVSSYKKLIQMADENQAVLAALDLSRVNATGAENTGVIVNAKNPDSLSQWKTGWHQQLNQLRAIVRDCPLPESTLIVAKDLSGNNVPINRENTLLPIDRESIIDTISSMERSYLEDLNKMEKAGNLLFSKYKGMARFSLAAAVFLDLVSAMIGAFLYFNKPDKKTGEKKTQPVTKPDERPDWVMEEKPVYS